MNQLASLAKLDSYKILTAYLSYYANRFKIFGNLHIVQLKGHTWAIPEKIQTGGLRT